MVKLYVHLSYLATVAHDLLTLGRIIMAVNRAERHFLQPIEEGEHLASDTFRCCELWHKWKYQAWLKAAYVDKLALSW